MTRRRLSGAAATSCVVATLGGAALAHGEVPTTTVTTPADDGPAIVGDDLGRTAPARTAPSAAPAPTTPERGPEAEAPAVVGTPTERDRARARTRRAQAETESRAERAEEADEEEADPDAARDDDILTGEGRDAEGVPTLDNPGASFAIPGAAPIGVPNFFIDKFRIPPFLLPIYQAAGIEYGVRWEVLAAINEIETDYGRNLNVSSAGAMGWMQFIPSSWKAFGVDANGDGEKDPYNPVDAIFAAARYLKEHGAATDLRKAVFAYNHADWYVDSVLMRARLIGGLPADLVGSLTGLTQGLFPVRAASRYADDLGEKDARRRVARGENAARPVESDGTRRGVSIFAREGAAVVAVQDGTVTRIGRSDRLGRFVTLRDTFGNRYTYARLGAVEATHAVRRSETPADASDRAADVPPAGRIEDLATRVDPSSRRGKTRVFANPGAPMAFEAGGAEQLGLSATTPADAPGRTRRVALKEGSRVVAGTPLGRIGAGSDRAAPRLLFEIRPAGRGAPRIDPKPILDGWKLLESTAIYRANGANPLRGLAGGASIGQILLLGKQALQTRVLKDPRIEIYPCGRADIRAGAVDRRVLATLAFLSANGLRPTVSSLRCGRAGRLTVSGNVSQHVTGSAVDISRINGLPVLGNQGPGSVTEQAVRSLVTLQGTMRPDQIISLITVDGADNTIALPDHADHLHVGWRPVTGSSRLGRQLATILEPAQWERLVAQIASIANPTVAPGPSRAAIPADAPVDAP